MAKKASKTTQDQLIDWAEDLGKLLGTAEVRAKGWLQQRQDVQKTLTQIRDTATSLLSELEGSAAKAANEAVRRGRPTVERVVAEVQKRAGGMSAAGRAAVSAAQTARWARIRAEKARAAKKKTAQ